MTDLYDVSATAPATHVGRGVNIWLAGKCIRHSANLRGFVDHARRAGLVSVSVREISGATGMDGDWSALVTCHFDDGSHGCAYFMDRGIAKRWGAGFAKRRAAAFSANS